MGTVFELFDARARGVVTSAQREAVLLKHDYIGSEHLLLGLLREGEGLAARALTSLGVSLEAAREWVAKVVGVGAEETSGHLPFTPRAKKTLELTLRESMRLGSDHIGTEHLLLGLIREGESVGVQTLLGLRVDLERLRERVLEGMEAGGAQ